MPTRAGVGLRWAGSRPPRRLAVSNLAFLLIAPVVAEVSPEGPPAVGVVAAEYKSITESDEFNGRIQARQRVDLVPRVSAFLDEQLFTEGAEVKTGDLLYRLERGPFEADVEAKQAAIAQAEAQLENANIAFARAEDLFLKEAGTQATLDDARATLRTAAAQLKSAHAQLRQSQINLDYTEIRSPIDGRIGRTSVTIGNVVSPRPAFWRGWSVRIRCGWSFRSRFGACWSCATAMPRKAASTRSRSDCACPMGICMTRSENSTS